MAEENVREGPETSHDSQAEIVRLNEKVVQLERELRGRDRTERLKTQEDLPPCDQVNLEGEGGRAEQVFESEDESGSDAELVGLIGKNKKVKKEWAQKLTKLERQCYYLMGSTQTGAKGKALLTDGLFSTTVSPFTDHIMSCQLPSKFKMPEIPVYTGLGDPIEHLASFRAHVMLHATPDEVACRAFPLTLAGGAWEWFRTLPPHSVSNFEGLARKFASQFMAGIVRKKPAQQLMTIKQGP
jgi:hypothetical protein